VKNFHCIILLTAWVEYNIAKIRMQVAFFESGEIAIIFVEKDIEGLRLLLYNKITKMKKRG